MVSLGIVFLLPFLPVAVKVAVPLAISGALLSL